MHPVLAPMNSKEEKSTIRTQFRLIVTHPQKQGNIYFWPYCAGRMGIDTRFLTGLYYRPDHFPYFLIRLLPAKRKQFILQLLNKRRIWIQSQERSQSAGSGTGSALSVLGSVSTVGCCS